ncbi:hypothetical protein TNCV_1701691 [Trichonephila clavipes]|nr:hypothetical protein TNCV_1701691 [Trichonephila clavipes]
MPVSKNTVSRRIDEMGENIEKQLVEKLKTRKFSVQMDESTLRDSEAVLINYAESRARRAPHCSLKTSLVLAPVEDHRVEKLIQVESVEAPNYSHRREVEERHDPDIDLTHGWRCSCKLPEPTMMIAMGNYLQDAPSHPPSGRLFIQRHDDIENESG